MAIAVRLIGGLALLFFLPGYLCTRMLRGRARFPKDLSLLEWLFISSLISVALSSWIALLLAELALFSLAAVLALLLATSLALLLFGRRASWRLPKPAWPGVLLIPILILLALLLYSPPYEYVLGNWDPGTYVNAGAHLAREESITIHDRLLREIPPVDRHLFYHTHLITQRYEGGMAIADSARGIVSPHFYHLYTGWIALFYSIAGVRFSLWVNVFFGILSLAAIYLAARELAGARAALLTSVLLMFSAAEIWNVRFPTSEITAQFFLWSGIFSLLRYQKQGGGAWAALSGVCFAEAFLTRVTAIAVLPFLILILFWRNWERWRREDLFFLVPVAAGLVHLFIQDATVCRSYIERQLEVMRSQGFTVRFLIYSSAAFLTALAVARLFLKGLKSRLRDLFGSRAFRISLSLLLLALVIFAYYVRPAAGESADARNLRELAWFVYPLSFGGIYFPLGLCLALAGAMLFALNGFDERRGGFFLLVIPIAVIFLYRKMIFPSYLWAIRRYIPLVFPALIFFTAHALDSIGRRKKSGMLLAGAIMLLLLISMQIRYAANVMKPDFPGTIDFMDSLAAPLDREGIYICEGSGLAAPLDYVYGLDVLQLSQQTPEKCRGVERVIGGLLAKGRRVYYISRGGWPISRSLNFVPLRQLPLRTDYLEHSVGRFPRNRNPVQVNARLFRVEPIGKSTEAGAEHRLLDIGEDCFGLIYGFHGLRLRWEEGAQHHGRWTAGEAELVIPTFGSRQDLQITLAATAGGRRPSVPVPVTISINGKKIARLEIGRSLGEYRFSIPASALPAGKLRASLRISAPVWNPADVGLEGYPPDLGIYIERIIVETART
jgi:4-amino-4-deoxy-L-arabinose transferase-like glycosyltransferase